MAWQPASPIRFVVPYGSGGPANLLGRLLGPKLEAALGQKIVVKNHLGNALVVNPAVPAKSFAELVPLAKAQPGELSYASG